MANTLYVPLDGGAIVTVHFFPEAHDPSKNVTPQVDTPGVAARVSVFSSPVVGPSFSVRSEYVIPVKSKSEGNATAKVLTGVDKAVGVLNLIKWVDNPLAV